MNLYRRGEDQRKEGIGQAHEKDRLKDRWLKKLKLLAVYHFSEKEKIMKRFMAFFKEEDGASLIEYVLLAALIGVAAITAMQAVATQSNAALNNAAGAMTPAAGS
jgi:pilus assembly protein Flp/PilA